MATPLDSLTMNDVHRVADLPGAPAPGASSTQSNKAIPDYFARYEKEFELPVVRPVKVTSVRNAQENPQLLEVQSENESWLAETVVSASGTWTHPFLPYYPGAEKFKGLQIHAAGYTLPMFSKTRRYWLSVAAHRRFSSSRRSRILRERFYG